MNILSNIIKKIVKNNLCIGCGICAGLCPNNALQIQWNIYGEYNPFLLAEKCNDCNFCLKICPFAGNNDNEDDIGKRLFHNIHQIQHNIITGYYLDAGIGSIVNDEDRLTVASGGLASWLLQKLLENELVDAVICVTETRNPQQLFRFSVVKTKEEVKKTSGSVYYPVELSDVVKFIIDNPNRYAIICLPCFIKALRLAQKNHKILNERIHYFIGLTCGRLVSAHFTQYAAHCAEIREEIISVCYRKKRLDRKPGDYYSEFTYMTNKKKELRWNSVKLWTVWHGLGTPVCNFCDDIFAECADITFMDAWIPECLNNPKGTSLWVSRSRILSQLLNSAISTNEIIGNNVPIDTIIESQTNNGLIKSKRENLNILVKWMKNKNKIYPAKRNFILNTNISQEEESRIIFGYRFNILCRNEWVKCDGNYQHMTDWIDKHSKVSEITRLYQQMKTLLKSIFIHDH